MLSQIRERGYAINTRNADSADAGKTSAIAVPIIRSSGRVAGTLSLIYFATSMNYIEAAEKYYAILKGKADEISAELAFIGGL